MAPIRSATPPPNTERCSRRIFQSGRKRSTSPAQSSSRGMPMDSRPVLIAGGGPVGIITALALAQRGVPVRLFEAADAVNEAPRASTLHPATLEMIAAVGMLDDVVAQGLVART